eukprot:jgi/Hompol1/6941/HPOL_005128-RA
MFIPPSAGNTMGHQHHSQRQQQQQQQQQQQPDSTAFQQTHGTHSSPGGSGTGTTNGMGAYAIGNAAPQNPKLSVPQQSDIYCATYSGIPVYEMMCCNVAVMRRQSDSYLNATQILKVAGVEKGRRTKILEREIMNGEHEKVQGGYGKYQGTWYVNRLFGYAVIPFNRGVAMAQQFSVDGLLSALISFNPADHDRLSSSATCRAASSGRRNSSSYRKSSRHSVSSAVPSQAYPVVRESSLDSTHHSKRLRSSPTPSQRSQPSQLSQSTLPLSARFAGLNNAEQDDETDEEGTFNQVTTLFHQPSDMSASFSSSSHSESQLMVDNASMPPRDTESGDSAMHINGKPSSCQDGMLHTAAPAAEPNPSNRASGASQLPGFGASGTDLECNGPSAEVAMQHRSSLLALFMVESDTLVYPDFLLPDNPLPQDFSIDIALDDLGHSALHYAAVFANIHLLRLIICKGASIDLRNRWGETPLMRS